MTSTIFHIYILYIYITSKYDSHLYHFPRDTDVSKAKQGTGKGVGWGSGPEEGLGAASQKL